MAAALIPPISYYVVHMKKVSLDPLWFRCLEYLVWGLWPVALSTLSTPLSELVEVGWPAEGRPSDSDCQSPSEM